MIMTGQILEFDYLETEISIYMAMTDTEYQGVLYT